MEYCRLLFFTIVFFVAFQAYAERTSNRTATIESIDSINNTVFRLYIDAIDEAYRVGKDLYAKSDSIDYGYGKSFSNIHIARYYRFKGAQMKALETLYESLLFYKHDVAVEGQSNSNISKKYDQVLYRVYIQLYSIYRDMAQYELAFKYIQLAEKHFKRTTYRREQLYGLLGIRADMFKIMGQHDRAIKLYEEILTAARKDSLINLKYFSLGALSNLYLDDPNKLPIARKYIKEAQLIAAQRNNADFIVNTKNTLSLLLLKEGKYSEMLHVLDGADTLTNNKNLEISVIYNRAQAYYKLGHYEKAEKLAMKSLEGFMDMGEKEDAKEAALLLQTIYTDEKSKIQNSKSGQLEMSDILLRIENQLMQSKIILSQEQQKRIKEMENSINRSYKQLLFNKRSQKLIWILSIIGCMIFLYYFYKRKQMLR